MINLEINSELISINLKDLIEQLGEDKTKDILSSFECPMNMDVQNFLRYKAIPFSKQGISATHLIYCYSNSEKWGTYKELVGYYTITTKNLVLHKKAVTNTIWKKALKFCNNAPKDNKCILAAPLIGQLGKNFANGNDALIKGSELLELALNKIKQIQNEIGGKFTYLECEDNEKLISFYEENGFTVFGKRQLDRDETDIKGEHLIQLLKYIK